MVLALLSLASGAAGFYYGSRGWASPLVSRFLLGVAALFAACVALLIADSVLVLCVIGLAVGVTVAPALINGNTLIGRLVSPTASPRDCPGWAPASASVPRSARACRGR